MIHRIFILSFLIVFFILPENCCCWIIKGDRIYAQKNDNLWAISESLYGKGSEYKKFWDTREPLDISNNPNLIYPGMSFEKLKEKIPEQRKELGPLVNILQNIDKVYKSNESINKKTGIIIDNLLEIKKSSEATKKNTGNLAKIEIDRKENFLMKLIKYMFNNIFIAITVGLIVAFLSEIIKGYVNER